MEQKVSLKKLTTVPLLKRLNEKYPLMSIVQRNELQLEVVLGAGEEMREEAIRGTQKTLLPQEGEETTNTETQYQA